MKPGKVDKVFRPQAIAIVSRTRETPDRLVRLVPTPRSRTFGCRRIVTDVKHRIDLNAVLPGKTAGDKLQARNKDFSDAHIWNVFAFKSKIEATLIDTLRKQAFLIGLYTVSAISGLVARPV